MADYTTTALFTSSFLLVLTALHYLLGGQLSLRPWSGGPSGGHRPPPPPGETTFKFRYLQRCRPDVKTTGGVVVDTALVTRTGGSFKYSANVTLEVPLSDDLDIVSDVGRREEESGPTTFRRYHLRGACSNIRYFRPDFFSEILDAANVTDCPIPPGSYELRDLPMDAVGPPRDERRWPQGSYTTLATLLDSASGDIVFCLMFQYDLVPKRK